LRLLLDTHVFLWWSGRRPLAPAATEAIRAPGNDVLVSAASVWEAEINAAGGKLRLEADLVAEPPDHGFLSLDITAAHAVAAARLPAHHGDPFDRMLVAQAQLEGLTIVTRDPIFEHYAVAVLTA
jgi:PIN domain nuclease of toxin-antitoxin system